MQLSEIRGTLRVKSASGLPSKYRNIIRSFAKIKHFICDALLDLVPYTQFKKREKHP